MAIPILGPILTFLNELGRKYMDARLIEAEGRIAIARAKAEAAAQIEVSQATAEIQWDLTQADASKYSWKDEFWTIVLSIPVIGVFIPRFSDQVFLGFQRLDQLPDWYKAALGIAIGAAFGYRKLVDYMQRKKSNG